MPKSGRRVVIDEARCRGCGLCVLACPAACLEFTTEFNRLGYHSIRYSGEGCRGDGRCIAACPDEGVIVILEEDRSWKIAS